MSSSIVVVGYRFRASSKILARDSPCGDDHAAESDTHVMRTQTATPQVSVLLDRRRRIEIVILLQ